ncbi:superinfection exclusion B family protein [Escherichia coli]|uniref:super-infection exclusion protein B n=1 Tax=Escherichia coli TaxID=562 RepID=UPI0013753A8C|nr:super-infection exclusion protein B [Escherichia coli]ELS8134111.1 superinfection exclusion B family protein [Escherichia coli]ELV1435860.1 superinfection exclusion B family protein [Escherichia coli]MBZ8395771.1 superinfection exclusion B family protein [Escherichia coli]MBZ8405632.1 superinfection exclusion B family protein [Escherichia coli]MBZ8411560.1 superinfection exclusion B family protein [Escherichia coli]
MRLRVVPGFISPPPGFGGLCYTPTARACVNISIPLQLRVIEMLESLLTLAKFFAEKSVSRFMITIVIFFLILMLVPENLSEYLEKKSAIPYSMQLFCFSIAFVSTLILDRVVILFLRMFYLIRDFVKKRKMLKNLNSLNAEQIRIIELFLQYNCQLTLCPDNPNVALLVKMRIISFVRKCSLGNDSQFQLNPEYEDLIFETWNPCTKRFE